MKVRDESLPKSSFLAMEKDLGLITNLFIKNERLKKLLHYTTSDALKQPNLSEEERATSAYPVVLQEILGCKEIVNLGLGGSSVSEAGARAMVKRWNVLGLMAWMA